jgi:glycosyltransferase involved in cell wall biosynthesis
VSLFGNLKDGKLVDRYKTGEDGIDVLMVTLDAAPFLERSLVSLYSEVPVARLLVCDGGSKDDTVSILQRFPRVELHIRPDIRTSGKSVEFLISKARTEWVMLTDADLTFPEGWYDEMCKYRTEYDAFDSKRIHAYEFYREDPATSRLEARPLVTCPQMGKLEAVRKYKVDDDYIWRITDIAMRQAVEKNGYRYGKVTTTHHYHHTTEETKYASDPTKVATKVIFKEPAEIIVNEANWRRRLVDSARGYVKYIDPTLSYVASDEEIDKALLPLLDRDWVVQTGPAWIPRYDRAIRAARRRNLPLIKVAVRLKRLLGM